MLKNVLRILYIFYGVHCCAHKDSVDGQKRKYDATLNFGNHLENPVKKENSLISIATLGRK